MSRKKLLLGNEAIAYGLAENGCAVAASYPGTPASEILYTVASLKKNRSLDMHVQWAVNEKVAFEIAYTASLTGLRSAVSMKQVGLNVASDPLMSAAYMGCIGGFLIISADDPGPHSSQTEQDSRLMAMMAKIPVLDPDSPATAGELVALGYEISETFETPVMIRPTTRVCHARQDVSFSDLHVTPRIPRFEKNPARWAATPKFRHQLHKELEKKLDQIAAFKKSAPVQLNPEAGYSGKKAVVASGVVAAHTAEIIRDLGLEKEIPLFKVFQPYPLHREFIRELLNRFEEILVIEEPDGVMEMQFADRNRVKGKLSGQVPAAGELLPETIVDVLSRFAGISVSAANIPAVAGKRPTLCAGCPHRASFFAVKKAAPRGIYTSDIGCYTLGLNLGAVDTFICMGATISQAAGFYQSFKNREKRPDIVATIGDSTFFHSGIPALIDAVNQNVRFVLVILDNHTTAMTGNQPTPASETGAYGEKLCPVQMENLVRSCGIGFLTVGNPLQLPEFIATLKEAVKYSREKGPAVVIARHPCLLDRKMAGETRMASPVEITDNCDGCGFCVTQFECPALSLTEDESRAVVDELLCSQCGVCVHVCPKSSIVYKNPVTA